MTIPSETRFTKSTVTTQLSAAQTITTDTDGLIVGDVRIPVADGEISAYRAMPAAATNVAVVLVVQELFGVHEYLRDVCRRLAKLGYMAIAPDLFIRQGDVSQIEDIQTIFTQIVPRVPDSQVISDLDATVAWAATSGGDINRLGITGFCWGGRIVWLYAAHSLQLKAGVAWYGPLTGQATLLQPQTPLDIAAFLKAPVLGLYGAMDEYIPTSLVKQMQHSLKEAGSSSEFTVYPDASHGFHADYRPSYHKQAAENGWQRLQAFFKLYGVV